MESHILPQTWLHNHLNRYVMENLTIKFEEHKKLILQSDIKNQAKRQELFQDLVLVLTNKEEKSLSTDNESNECKICMEKQKNVVLVPCGHTMCDGCAQKFQKGQCPTCRTRVSSTQKFFL